MFKRMAGWIVTRQIDRQILERRDESLYLFAYESMIGQLANILIAILIAFVFHSWLPVVCFLTAYIPLRSYAGGGYHADSHGRCCVVSAVILVLISGFDKVLSGAFFHATGDLCADDLRSRGLWAGAGGGSQQAAGRGGTKTVSDEEQGDMDR